MLATTILLCIQGNISGVGNINSLVYILREIFLLATLFILYIQGNIPATSILLDTKGNISVGNSNSLNIQGNIPGVGNIKSLVY